MNKSPAVPFALGAACAALLCLAQRRCPEQFSESDIHNHLRQIHDDLFIQRRLSVQTKQVLNDAHRLIHGVSKGLEKKAS